MLPEIPLALNRDHAQEVQVEELLIQNIQRIPLQLKKSLRKMVAVKESLTLKIKVQVYEIQCVMKQKTKTSIYQVCYIL